MAAERSWRVALRVALCVVASLLVVLAVTGVILAFRYRPDVAQVYNAGGQVPGRSVLSARTLHRVATLLLLPAVVALVVAGVGCFVVRRQIAPSVLSVVPLFLTGAAGLTGIVLPWDQLALRRVTVGVNYRGYGAILRGTDVKYVLIGNNEISTSTFAYTFWMHALLIPLGLVVVLVVLTVLMRQRAPEPIADQRA